MISAIVLPLTALAAPAHAEDGYSVTVETLRGDGVVAGAGVYAPGDTVTITATPDSGQVWEGWTSDELEWIGARTATFVMPAEDVDLTTSFRAEMRSLKDVYADHFDMGTIWASPASFTPGTPISNTIDRHYNIITAENAMKPDALLPNNNIDPETGEFTFRFGEADGFVDQSRERGMKVHGHVLVWHSQSPARINTGATGGTRDLARANMERFIEGVLTHFSDRIDTWDVVNEAFVDGISSFDPATQDWRDYLRGGPQGGQSNWYSAYANGTDAAAGEHPADFIYDAFVLAREYGPEAKLEYNDFNVFQSAGKGKAIVAMAEELNARYAEEHPEDPRLLIEAIGMQSHNYINQTPAFACSADSRLGGLVDDNAAEWRAGACSDTASVEASIQQIVAAGMDVAISELDLMVWEAWNGQPEGSSVAEYRDLTDPSVKDRISREGFTYWVDKISNRAELEAIQAQRFAEYFAVYKEYAQHIDRVTFWGLTDRLNWRATHNPLFLNEDWSEKLSAWAIADPEGWFARDGAGGDGIPVEATVPDSSTPGSLALTVAEFGDGVVLESTSSAGDRLRFAGALPTVTVTDSRNAEQANGGGWALSGQSTSFTANAGSLGAEHLGWTPRLLEPRAGVVGGDPVDTVLSGGPGLASPAPLARADVDGRAGSTPVGAELRLDVPVDTEPGTYRSTVTVSLFAED